MTAPEAAQQPSSPSSARRVLNVGILGLGARWQKRYAAALRALTDHFRVRVVCDAMQERADHEARALTCAAAAGPTELLEHADVDALLLLDAAWYRLWPLELACRLGKPVLCAVPLDQDEHADAIGKQVRDCGLVVVMDMLPQLEAMSQRLRQMFAGPLGPPRLVLCDWAQGKAGGVTSSAALLDWCVGLLGAAPSSVVTTEAPAARLASVLLEFPEGRAVQLVHRTGTARGRLRLQIVTAHGQVVIDGPRRVQWSDAEGRHSIVLPRARPPLQVLLERFHRAVTTGQAVQPDLEQAQRSLVWLRAVARSRAEGRKVEIG